MRRQHDKPIKYKPLSSRVTSHRTGRVRCKLILFYFEIIIISSIINSSNIICCLGGGCHVDPSGMFCLPLQYMDCIFLYLNVKIFNIVQTKKKKTICIDLFIASYTLFATACLHDNA